MALDGRQKSLYTYYIVLALVALTIFVTNRLKNSRIGRAWMALREDEIASVAMGVDMARTKLSAYALSLIHIYQALLAVSFATDTLKAKKIAIIHDKGDYGKGFADFSKEAIEKGGKAKVVMYEGIQPGAMDYSAVIQKLRSEGADTLIFGSYHPEASKLLSQMNKKKIKVAFVGPDGIKGDGFLKIAGKDAEGIYATGPKDVSKLPLNTKAREDYKTKYNKEPDTFFDQAYSCLLYTSICV